MKKIVSLMLVLALMLSLLSIPAFADTKPDIDIYARHALLVNTDTDTVVYENDAYSKDYPASLTKIMTAIIALENTENLDAVQITARPSHFNEFQGLSVSTADIRSGESFSMRELLYALMLNSACEAANIIADYVSNSSNTDFITLMNNKAKEIGATNTHFANPHGLFHEDNYSTAYDMYLITNYAMNVPGFLDIACTKNYTIEANSDRGEKRLYHTNKMLFSSNAQFGKYYMPEVKGIKTGTLDEAGLCLITCAEYNGYNYICVVMGGDSNDPASRYKTTYNIYNWAFDNLMLKTLLEETKSVSEVKVNLSKDKEYVLVRPATRVTRMVDVNIDPSSVILTMDLPESVNAPVKAGDIIGKGIVTLMGEEVATVDLVAMQDVERSGLKMFTFVMGEVMSKPAVIIGTIVFVALLAFYAILSVMYNNYKRRRRRYRRY